MVQLLLLLVVGEKKRHNNNQETEVIRLVDNFFRETEEVGDRVVYRVGVTECPRLLVSNDGYIARIDVCTNSFDCRAFAVFDDQSYYLSRFLLHRGSDSTKGSEHTVCGFPRAAEVQFVFELEEGGHPEVLVLAALLEVGGHNVALAPILDTYVGSSARPPRERNVARIVLEETLEVAENQLEQLRSMTITRHHHIHAYYALLFPFVAIATDTLTQHVLSRRIRCPCRHDLHGLSGILHRRIHTSGILATASAGLVLARRPFAPPPVIVSIEAMEHAWEAIEYLGNTLVFALAGVLTRRACFFLGGRDPRPRVRLVLGSSRGRLALKRASTYGTKPADAIFMVWGGLRGAVGLALALYVNATLESNLNLKNDDDDADRVLFSVAGVALLTLVINAPTSGPMLRALGLAGKHEQELLATRQLSRQPKPSTETRARVPAPNPVRQEAPRRYPARLEGNRQVGDRRPERSGDPARDHRSPRGLLAPAEAKALAEEDLNQDGRLFTRAHKAQTYKIAKLAADAEILHDASHHSFARRNASHHIHLPSAILAAQLDASGSSKSTRPEDIVVTFLDDESKLP
ncbi:hypothetical protein CTAYLR_002614 [Chrysophaeum taylorii]|uniref:Alpha-carbonic anhydrase domain-containing protein n=1 Tax=Chrysophaeum taylorii TaxID=2483200 RepID=A0AAD7UFM3_9STRA|nr:hypothetical protein CTAYLR_002614 [Chrysophaeum taylorii]